MRVGCGVGGRREGERDEAPELKRVERIAFTREREEEGNEICGGFSWASSSETTTRVDIFR